MWLALGVMKWGRNYSKASYIPTVYVYVAYGTTNDVVNWLTPVMHLASYNVYSFSVNPYIKGFYCTNIAVSVIAWEITKLLYSKVLKSALSITILCASAVSTQSIIKP